MSEAEEARPKTRPLVSAVLEDGTIIETIYRPELNETALVTWQNGAVAEHRDLHLSRLGRVTPYSPDNNLLSHGVVLFPSAVGEHGSTQEILTAVRSFIHRYADVGEVFEEVASYYVLLSWIYEAFNEVPYLRLKGDFGSGKSRCLLTIGSLCYKPMFVSGASTVSPMFRIIDTFRGTLVLDESDFRFSDEKAEIVKILNNGNAVGFPVLRSEATPTKEYNPRAFAVFGPKIIASRAHFEDRALESRCITEVMSGLSPRPDIPLSLPPSFHAEARELRNKLLSYRFRNLLKPHDLAYTRDPGVEARVAQVFAPLLAIVEDDSARARLIALAHGNSGAIVAERSASIEAQLLDIIVEMRRDGIPLGVKDIAERFTERFGLEYQRPITPRWIGAQLRNRLSLMPVKNHGMFIVPSTNEPKLISLFERYDLVDVPKDMGTLGTSQAVPPSELF